MQFSLNAFLLGITLFSVWVVQASTRTNEERLYHLSFATKLLSTINFVILIATLHYYKHYKTRAVWLAAFAVLFATGITILFSKLVG